MQSQTLLEQTRAISDGIRKRARRAEQLRQLPAETVAELQEAGVFSVLQPSQFGGQEADPCAFFEAIMELSGACASTGWTASVLGLHAWQLGRFEQKAQAEVWKETPHARIAASFQHTNAAQRVEGGFVLSGNWDFASGCDHSDWALVAGWVDSESLIPEVRTFLVPRSDFRIEDNWRVMGLCATGSKSLVLQEVFVPEHRCHTSLVPPLSDNLELSDSLPSLYRLPAGALFAHAVAVPALGAALGALELLSDSDAPKERSEPVTTKHAPRLRAQRKALLSTWRTLFQAVKRGQEITVEEAITVQGQSVAMVEASVNAIDDILRARGARALFEDKPLQRAFRDIHAMQLHTLNNPF